MISTVLMTIMLLGLFALMATAALAPLETLSWWAGWTEEELGETPPAPSSEARPALRYIVYLSGVASISGRYLLPREISVSLVTLLLKTSFNFPITSS